MSISTYKLFDLRFDCIHTPDYVAYRATVIESPVGQISEIFCYGSQLEPTKLFFEAANFSIGNANSFDAKTIGRALFEFVFRGKLHEHLLRSLDFIYQNEFGLRIRLRLNDVPELASLPWEYLYEPERYGFLALSPATPIVRYLELSQGSETLLVEERLRILVVICDPLDNSQNLSVQQELVKLQNTLNALHLQAQIDLEPLRRGTIEELQRRLWNNDKPIHILHFIGHGSNGVLYFENAQQEAEPITAEQFATFIRDHRSLRLIFLNTCEGALSEANNIFSGVAQTLVQKLPSSLLAVIGMQFTISDRIAVDIAQKFYEAILHNHPVDAALVEARKSVWVRSNHEWGTPVLFMRANDGKLFDIPQTQLPSSFQKVILESELDKIESSTNNTLVKLLQDNHLLILGDQPWFTLQTVTHKIAQTVNNISPDLSVWEWEDDASQLNFAKLFPYGDMPYKAPSKGLYIIPRVSPKLVEGINLIDLASTLIQRQQYLILTTSSSITQWKFNESTSRFWGPLVGKIYRSNYLIEQLESKLHGLEGRLPAGFLDKIKVKRSEYGYSLQKIAEQLASPTNMDTFVRRLSDSKEAISRDVIRKYIQISLHESVKDKVEYLYFHLERDEQLLAVGLYLFGELYEIQFYKLLERLIKARWWFAFTSVEILDYYHFDNLRPFFSYTIVQSAQINTSERKMLPVYDNQWWLLLQVIWESHRNHLWRALPEVSEIVKDLVSIQRDEYGDEQKRKWLRRWLSSVLSDVGRLSVQVVEDTLLDLASHGSSRAQTTVAEAIAGWYIINGKGDAQDQLFKLLESWQNTEWKGKRSDLYIQLTIARTLNHVLKQVADPIPEPLSALLLKLPQSTYKKVRNYFESIIQPKIFPRHLVQLISHWQAKWNASRKPKEAVDWLPVILTIAHACENDAQLQQIASWLVDILHFAAKQDIESVLKMLEKNRFIIHKIFPFNLHILNEGNILLPIVQSTRFHKEIIRAFTDGHHQDALLVPSILQKWQVQWHQHLSIEEENSSSEDNDQKWLNGLATIGIIYDQIGHFREFAPWLIELINRRTPQKQPEVVEILYAIHLHQIKKGNNDNIGNDSLYGAETELERLLYAWLIDETKSAAIHQTVFWFSGKAYGITDRRYIHTKPPEAGIYLKYLVPFLSSPFNRRHRAILRNLLPIVNKENEDHPGKADKIVHRWCINSNIRMQGVAKSLNRALLICEVIRALQNFIHFLQHW